MSNCDQALAGRASLNEHATEMAKIGSGTTTALLYLRKPPFLYRSQCRECEDAEMFDRAGGLRPRACVLKLSKIHRYRGELCKNARLFCRQMSAFQRCVIESGTADRKRSEHSVSSKS